jgi:hypothetical protein
LSKKPEVVAFIASLQPEQMDLEGWFLQWAEWVNIKLLKDERDEIVNFIDWAEDIGVDLTKFKYDRRET